MGKITVKHYLNKSVAKANNTDATISQVYVQITVKRQVNRIRSRAHKFVDLKENELQMTQKEFEIALANKDKGVGKALFLECSYMKDLITFLDPFEREEFSVKDFTKLYEIATSKVYEDIDISGKKQLIGMLGGNWEIINKIINWELPFNLILDGLELIGSKNKDFNEDILCDKILVPYKVAIRHIDEFLIENTGQTKYGLENCNSYMLYWIKNEMYLSFVQFLSDKKYIHPELDSAVHKVLILISKAKGLQMKLLSLKT
ncbi:hypothetical protein GCM10023188_07460 [Pontibacter saemangeumensis]|uniref:Uncharacterized protein n=1 Tax=Pontibacter saemangeumensis TaxID=1084525 RepID=A0ABP8LAE0_9BACT